MTPDRVLSRIEADRRRREREGESARRPVGTPTGGGQ
jgi:hypothetical protein